MTDKIRFITPEDTSQEAIAGFKALPEDVLAPILDAMVAAMQTLGNNPEWYIGKEIGCAVGKDQTGKPVFDVTFIVQEVIEHDHRKWAVGPSHEKSADYEAWPAGSKYALELDGSTEIAERILHAFGRSLDEEVTDPDIIELFS